MKNHCGCMPAPAGNGRREFLKLAALGGGASLLSVGALLPRESRAAGATEALLLSCMDYRLMDDVERYMAGRGLQNKYDHIVLAGASLGAVTDRFPAWNQTFWEHLDIAIQLHAIRRVIVMDHRDCGAYKVVLGAAHAKDPETEKAAHFQQLARLRGLLKDKHPQLEVEILLMALDGKVEAVGGDAAMHPHPSHAL